MLLLFLEGVVIIKKLSVKNAIKIFGRNSNAALKMLEQGYSKDEIFKKTKATVAVNDVSFDVEEGEIFVIMGLSGSGKSTLIRMLNQLIKPTKGSIVIDDIDIAKINKKELLEIRRSKMSMVFQNFGLFSHKSVLENAAFGLEIKNINKEERRKKALIALENSGLAAYKDHYPHQLSGGMQQRVGIARALANDPEILLMDEAFSALDPLIRKEMQDELLSIQERVRKTIVFITHDLNEALRIGDRIALMKDGKIVQIGSGEEILTNPASRYVESFVQDVDRSKVLVAQNIMIKPVTLNIEKEGPLIALQKMKENSISLVLVVNNNYNLLGYLIAEDALKAHQEKKDIKEFIKEDIIKIEPDTLLNDVFLEISQSSVPMAVVENEKLKGIIIKGLVLEALVNYESELIEDESK